MTNFNGNSRSRSLTAVRPDVFQIFLQDEDGQNILGIDDGALRQSLRIEIVNASGRNIEFQPVDNQLSLDNYHFCISFRPGTLLLTEDEDKRITLKETDEGWQMQQQDNTFYLLLNSSEPRVIENGERITLTLENIGASPGGGSRGTRVEIKYNHLQYQSSNETISGNRLQYLNIVNQRGKKQIPLYVGFLGSNTILNDGSENELTLTIQSLPNQNSSLILLESPEIATTDTTRWQGNLLKFIQEKIPNFNSEIAEIAQNPNISTASQQFFALFKESVDSNDSFEDFQAKLTNLTLENSDKEIIFRILIDNLGVIIEEDLNAILTQLKGLLYPQEPTPQELERIRTIILEIIQESENFKVIKSELNPNGFLEFKGLNEEGLLDRAAKFTISFDVTTTDDNDSKNWALVDKTDADDIQIDIVRGQENWIFGGKEEQGITPRWSFICKQGLQLQERTEILRFSISKLKTQLLSGYANLYVHYENIPGYWDGYITVPIHKGSLVYREYPNKSSPEGVQNRNKVGCVGIGTDSPQAKLHIKSPDPNMFNGLKVDGNTLLAGKLSITDTSTLSGKVGIGIAPGSEQLKVNGNTAIAGSLQVEGSTRISGNLNVAGDGDVYLPGHIYIRRFPNQNIAYLQARDDQDKHDISLRIRTQKGNGQSKTITEAMTITSDGNVGIGERNPTKGKVQIQGFIKYQYPHGYRYFKRESNSDSITSGYNAPYSLYASDFIGAKEFNAISDMRIKEVKGVSDSKSDLKVLLQIDITDYTYKDKVANDSKTHKKVLGQQIAKVFPQAVKTHTDVVPDIFQPASIANGWVSLGAHGLQVGEQVQLLLEGSEPQICAIEAVTPESFQVSLDYKEEVFVYGREVDDFHVVDYDALSMLHISATQELYKIIHALKIEVQQLKAQLNGSHHTIAAINE